MPELKPNPSVRDLQRAFREALEPELTALAGLSFGLPLAPRGGAPFILHRQDDAQ